MPPKKDGPIVQINVDSEAVDTFVERGWVTKAEGLDARLTDKGLNAAILLTGYLAMEFEDGTWQFQGLQAFMAAAIQKLETYQAPKAHDGETQQGA